jgi:hypothetical protein
MHAVGRTAKVAAVAVGVLAVVGGIAHGQGQVPAGFAGIFSGNTTFIGTHTQTGAMTVSSTLGVSGQLTCNAGFANVVATWANAPATFDTTKHALLATESATNLSGANSGALFAAWSSGSDYGVLGALAPGTAWRSLYLQPSNTANTGPVSIGFNGGTAAVTNTMLNVYGAITGVAGSAATATTRAGGNLDANSTGVGNVGASGPDDLQVYTLPANALIHASRGLKVKCYGTTTNNPNAKTVRLLFGTTTVITKQLTASVAGFWVLEATILRTGTSAQDIFGEAVNYGGTAVSSTDGATVQDLATFATATETETAAIDIKTQSTVSTTDNDIISQGCTTDFL